MDGWMDKENYFIRSLQKCKERNKRVIRVPMLLLGRPRHRSSVMCLVSCMCFYPDSLPRILLRRLQERLRGTACQAKAHHQPDSATKVEDPC